MKALLIDSTLCMGCRGCQVACKEWNDLPAEPTTFFAGPGYQNPSDLSPSTWTLITYYESNNNGKMAWSFGKLQCMHCVDPACVTACP
ncbi:4Fe-4S dicluster domain-containing protein, partial [bacterium]|nr:4Fe-4S dicluster domain-containing protein [bacterium]